MNRLLNNAITRSTVAIRASSNLTTKAPTAQSITQQNAQFDKVTHTGQAWDQADYRLQRFDTSAKQVNPNVAMHLVDQRPPENCGDKRVIYCDGGHPALGHPKVYINLDKPGVHACGYCGNRFYNSHVTQGEDLKIQHLNC
ncbi:unnamed protein product [Caenorhabditis angaria]|uniref:NADH dehydrogenase [ubiquinone] iron-sulfur protein 6, mitochondrial n=1 Tax=Caenorhabditis angaria TaxID=860376 RepID=A0A9P1MVH7_9PELO|nr:unnamed protein product [Caenorhabditis angaria]